MFPIPDLIHSSPRMAVDSKQMTELLGLAFTGRETDLSLDRSLAATEEESSWSAEFFTHDLFLAELIRDSFRLTIDGNDYAVNHAFLKRTLEHPPVELDEVRFRQRILAELDARPELLRKIESLYRRLYDLMNMFKVPGRQARLDLAAFRIDLFKLVKGAIDDMVAVFGDAESGLRRLHEVGRKIQESSEYGVVAALLDYVDRRSTLNVDIDIGASGKITDLRVKRVEENHQNPFYRKPWWRWLTKLKCFFWYGYQLDDDQVVSRLVLGIFDRISPALMGLLQLLGHLELYLTSFAFRERVRSAGLEASLAGFDGSRPFRLEGLFNPLLLAHDRPPVACRVHESKRRGVILLTGPNSGGKTRFLQALGLAQLLGQSGLFAPARSANLSPVRGLFVSLIEHEAVEHAEGRLGRELERIRTMFDAMDTPSFVILDELCSGTNPSEAIEVFTMVLRLLEPLEPRAYISTHFLDFAHELEQKPPIAGLDFLQVEIGEGEMSTYQFVPGVAKTSLAAAIATRMGVTFGELSSAIARRRSEAVSVN